MNDRELLEAAAKAAGITLPHFVEYGVDDWQREWNPLTDDGDAFRLAAALRLNVDFMHMGGVFVGYGRCQKDSLQRVNEVAEHSDEPAADARRAIVRAAAALAKDTA